MMQYDRRIVEREKERLQEHEPRKEQKKGIFSRIVSRMFASTGKNKGW